MGDQLFAGQRMSPHAMQTPNSSSLTVVHGMANTVDTSSTVSESDKMTVGVAASGQAGMPAPSGAVASGQVHSAGVRAAASGQRASPVASGAAVGGQAHS